MLVCLLVLATFRFFGLAHLHSLWGCLVFVGFPLDLPFFVWVFVPLVSFLQSCLVFAGLFALLVWSGRSPDATDRLFRFRVHGVLSLRAVAAAGCTLVLRCCLFVGSSHQSSHARFNHAVRCLLGGSSHHKVHTRLNHAGVFCQSAIENAQKDQAAIVQNILANKDTRLQWCLCADLRMGQQ